MLQVIRKQIVARSLQRLRQQKIHTLFAGYLHLQQCAARLDRFENLHPDFLSFFKEFFYVGNHPLGAPYIKPFTQRKASVRNLWLNQNVAGTYAPSSLRPEQPFRKVVEVADNKYSLPSDHARRAFEHLLFFTQVQVADLAVVLYRDFGLLDNCVTIRDLIDVFAYEFGYAYPAGAEPDENFKILYALDAVESWEEEWLETAQDQTDATKS